MAIAARRPPVVAAPLPRGLATAANHREAPARPRTVAAETPVSAYPLPAVEALAAVAHRAAARRATAHALGARRDLADERETRVAFAAVAHGKFVNRGFVNGPICSIYGFGVMSVLLVLGPLKSSFWLLFGGSVLFTSAIEYLTGWVLEKVFHDKWWDYSKRPLNIKGYVCLEFSVLWGLACVFVVDVFQPLVAKVVDLIPKKLGWALLGTFSVLWITDNIITAMEIRKLPKKLRALQTIEDSLTAISDEIGEEIYIRASDAKDRSMEVYTDVKEKGAEIAEKGEQIAEKRAESSLMRRSELLARRSELLQRREELLDQRNIVHERIAQAFPALREGKTNGPAFTRVHEHAQRRKQLAKALKAKARELKNKAKDRS